MKTIETLTCAGLYQDLSSAEGRSGWGFHHTPPFTSIFFLFAARSAATASPCLGNRGGYTGAWL